MSDNIRDEQFLADIRSAARGEATYYNLDPIIRKEYYYTDIITALKNGGGGGGGTSDYTQLTNKPEINGTTLTGNKSSSDLGLQDKVLGAWTAGTATTHSTPASTDTVLQALEKIDNNQRNDETNILSKANITDVNTATANLQFQIDNISAPIIDTFEQGWIDISTGVPTANTNRCRTLKTLVKGGETLSIIANGMYYNVATWTGSTYNSIISNSWIQDNGRDLMFSEDRYVVVGVRKADNTNITPTDVVSIVVHNVNTTKRNILYGGTIIFDGDSICSAGSEGNAPYNGYAYRIGNGNTMAYHNVGVGGATIAGDTYYQDSSPRHWISRYIDTIHQNYPTLDYIIFEGGTNDADILGNDHIGTFDVNDYAGTYDDTTFTGALDTLFYKALNYYPTAKIGFIIAQKMGISNDYTPTGNIRRKFFERAMDVCKKWGIPYINLWDGSPLNPKLPCYYNSSLDEQGNRDGGYAYTDGQHLTGIGYDIISPAIESWIRTL